MRGSILFLVAISLTGCKKEPVPTPDAPVEQAIQSEPSPFSTATPPVIEVLDRGEEPRRTLGWSAVPGLAQALKIRIDTEFDSLMGMHHTKPVAPSLMLELTVRTDEQIPGKGRSASFTVQEARAHYDDETPPKVRQEIDEGVAALSGLRGSYRVGSFGTLEDVVLNVPPDASRIARSMGKELQLALRQLAAPLPTEPLGAGAAWTVDRGIDQDGFYANEVATLKITKLQNQLLTLQREVRQTAPPQTIRNTESAASVELTEFTANGRGEVVWDLTEAAPRSARMTFTENRRMQWESSGQPVKAMVTTKRTVTVESPKR